ncbi:CDP-glycerol glycerophosphotransferase family protein [Candidatus Nomurabacteria bacterium]|nr:CDP-glycerol glycerophosphotransferase family protein [Candidatus Nomurabacteria bacterium]
MTSKILTLIDIILSRIIFWLSFLVPKDKNTWIYIGWHHTLTGEIFADNTKYLFLYTSQNHPEIKNVWIAKEKALAKTLRERGYLAYYQNSPKAIWYSLRAGYTIIDAYLARNNFRYSGGSKVIQLLHGKGFKKEGYSKPQLKKQHVIFGPSQFALDLLPDSFKEGARTFIAGYSRNDVLFINMKDSDIGSDLEMLNKIESIKSNNPNTKIILYAPTYRRGKPELKLEEMLDMEDILPWLEKNNYYLLISLHPKYRRQTRRDFNERILMVPDCDIYPVLKKVDILINDYSSSFSDFLLLKRPIVFYPFDRESYEKDEGFNIDYDQYAPGPKAYSTEELIVAVDQILDNDQFMSKREKVTDAYHQFKNDKSSQRISQILIDNLKK